MNQRFLAASGWGLALVAALAGTSAVLALETLDGSAHPSVGHIFAQQSDPNTCSAEVIGFCSATLISPTVAVTSGGCAEAFATANEVGFNITAIWISFNGSDPLDCATASRVDSLHWHPNLGGNYGTAEDIGVAILTAPASAVPATLPAAGSLDGAVAGDPFDSVGWAQDRQGNILSARRRIGPLSFQSDDGEFLKMRLTQPGNNCATGYDGGAVFYPGSQNLAGLDNGASNGCKVGTFLRLDSATSRDFLDDFVTLP